MIILVHNCRDTRAGSSPTAANSLVCYFVHLNCWIEISCFTSVFVFPKDLFCPLDLHCKFWVLQTCVFMIRITSHVLPNFLCMTIFSVFKRVVANLSLEFLVVSVSLIFMFFCSITLVLCWFSFYADVQRNYQSAWGGWKKWFYHCSYYW